jgi:hypothetical protein
MWDRLEDCIRDGSEPPIYIQADGKYRVETGKAGGEFQGKILPAYLTPTLNAYDLITKIEKYTKERAYGRTGKAGRRQNKTLFEK